MACRDSDVCFFQIPCLIRWQDFGTPCAGTESPILVLGALKNTVVRVFGIELDWGGVVGAEEVTWWANTSVMSVHTNTNPAQSASASSSSAS